MLVALVAIPFLVSGLGTARFGVLTLTWIVIGYFGLFDLGIGRALTQLVADKLGAGEEEMVPPLVWTGLSAMMLFGTIGAVVLAAGTPGLVRGVLRVPDALAFESIYSFYLLAFSLPWVIGTAGLRGVLEAAQRFDLVNAVRLPMGVLNFVGPLLVLPFSHSLVPIVVVLVVGRIIAWGFHLVFCLQSIPALRSRPCLSRVPGLTAPLLRMGAWMTVSNIVSPLMVYMDRFIIGALLSVSAVAYYATPYEMVTKLWLIPTAVLGTFFPAFAASAGQRREQVADLFDRAIRVVFVMTFPIALVIVALAPEALNLWLGPEFARNGTEVTRWLAAGVFVNSVAQVPFALIQGVGRPDVTAKLHMLELPVYFAVFWWGIRVAGIEGAAIAWTVRVMLDTAVLFAFAGRKVLSGNSGWLHPYMWLVAGLLVLGGASLPASLLGRGMFLAATLAMFGGVAWKGMLRSSERALLRLPVQRMVRALTPSN